MFICTNKNNYDLGSLFHTASHEKNQLKWIRDPNMKAEAIILVKTQQKILLALTEAKIS